MAGKLGTTRGAARPPARTDLGPPPGGTERPAVRPRGGCPQVRPAHNVLAMPRWSASTPRGRSLVWPAVGLVFGGMSVVETAIDTVYDYGMVTALPDVAVGVLLSICPPCP